MYQLPEIAVGRVYVTHPKNEEPQRYIIIGARDWKGWWQLDLISVSTRRLIRDFNYHPDISSNYVTTDVLRGEDETRLFGICMMCPDALPQNAPLGDPR